MKWTPEHIQNARNFQRSLKKERFNFFTGVPCSLLGALIEELEDSGYIPSPREDAAVGMASGAFLAGKRPVVLMQNSGIGYSLNVLTSLNLIYKIPILCLVTYRGFGPDAPEHIVMGKSCVKLLQEIGMTCFVPEKEELVTVLEKASRELDETKQPVAIFIKKGIFGA